MHIPILIHSIIVMALFGYNGFQLTPCPDMLSKEHASGTLDSTNPFLSGTDSVCVLMVIGIKLGPFHSSQIISDLLNSYELSRCKWAGSRRSLRQHSLYRQCLKDHSIQMKWKY
jgi:hypothetical protein